jgi:hypothetical protein
MTDDSGIIKQNIDYPELLLHGSNRTLDGFLVSDVELD